LCRSCTVRHVSAANVFRRDWGNDLVFLPFNGMLIKLGLLAVMVAIFFCRRLGTGHPHAANREHYFPGKSRGQFPGSRGQASSMTPPNADGRVFWKL
jgi:hypothetical protein